MATILNVFPASATDSTESNESIPPPVTLQPCASIIAPTRLDNLTVSSRASRDEWETRLDDGYCLHRFDVLCTRDKESFFHVGNNRFRVCVEMKADRYLQAKTRKDKTAIVVEILDAVRASGGRFVREERTSSFSKINIDGKGVSTLDPETNKRQASNFEYVCYDIGRKKSLEKIGKALRFEIQKKALGLGKQQKRRSLTVQADGCDDIEGLQAHSTVCDGKQPTLTKKLDNLQRNPGNDNGLAGLNFDHKSKTRVVVDGNDSGARKQELVDRRKSWHAGFKVTNELRCDLSTLQETNEKVAPVDLPAFHVNHERFAEAERDWNHNDAANNKAGGESMQALSKEYASRQKNWDTKSDIRDKQDSNPASIQGAPYAQSGHSFSSFVCGLSDQAGCSFPTLEWDRHSLQGSDGGCDAEAIDDFDLNEFSF